MFKKVISLLLLSAISLFVLPIQPSLALQDCIQNFDVQVDGDSIDTFYPSAGDVATVKFTLTEDAGTFAQVRSESDFSEVALLSDYVSTGAGEISYLWYGRVGNVADGAVLPNGKYRVNIFAVIGGQIADFDSKLITIANAQDSLAIQSFTAVASGNDNLLDPAPSGNNENLTVNYTLSQAADAVNVQIKDSNSKLLKTYTASSDLEKITSSVTWDGRYGGNLVDPGVYSVILTATKAGLADLTQTLEVTVAYDNANKPVITDFSISPESFDPDFEDSEIKFKITKDADLTFEIQKTNGDEIRGYSEYENDNYNANEQHSIIWDGNDNSNNEVEVGNYKAYLRARNEYGVSVESKTVSINDSLGNITTSNAHVQDISFSPSSTFEPAEDEELVIEFDVKTDLDELIIVAMQGSTEIELYNEEDVEAENNLEVTWDGTDDDDEYVSKGSWKIVFKSKNEDTSLQAAKSINISYDEPQIEDFYLSKDKFDPDLGEFTYVMFRVDSDALVDVFVLESDDEDDEIAEDLEVEKDKWYAIEWDGGSYDYDDDIDIKVVAKNKANTDIYNSVKKGVDLAEDEVSSSKSNVTGDYISPVLTNGTDSMVLYYDLEDEADVTITIHKGTSGSGSKVIELLDSKEQDGDSYDISWDGKDDDGDKLSKGIYTYKIVAKTGSSETEEGHFIVGEVGDIDGTASGEASDEEEDNEDDDDNSYQDEDYYCAGFNDVTLNSKNCDAIEWVKQENIFIGYADGTFKENQPINRVEVLKVILEAFNSNLLPDDGTNQGFKDVIIGEWYVSYIRTAKMLAIFHGDAGKNTARPEESVNRVELLKFIFETLKVQNGYSVSSCSYSYPDAVSNAWYTSYACESKEYNLFDGANLFPSKLSTRGEVADVLFRLHEAGLM